MITELLCISVGDTEMHPDLDPQCEGCDQQVAISSQSIRVHFSFRDSPFWAWPVSTSHGTALQAPFIPELPTRLSGFAGHALAFDFFVYSLHLCLLFYGSSPQ